MNGKEVMILQLEQIALNYKDTAEGEKAIEMLNYLKSELQITERDSKGNIVNKNMPPSALGNSIIDNSASVEALRAAKEKEAKELEQNAKKGIKDNRPVRPGN